MNDNQQGISNRESAREEEQERREHPPTTPDAPPTEQDAAGREGEEPLTESRDRQTSHKTGSRSRTVCACTMPRTTYQPISAISALTTMMPGKFREATKRMSRARRKYCAN